MFKLKMQSINFYGYYEMNGMGYLFFFIFCSLMLFGYLMFLGLIFSNCFGNCMLVEFFLFYYFVFYYLVMQIVVEMKGFCLMYLLFVGREIFCGFFIGYISYYLFMLYFM